MIWRAALLALLAAAIVIAWAIAAATHRRRLRGRLIAAPYSAMVFTSPDCSGCRTQERLLASLDPETASRVRYVDVTRSPEQAQRFGVLTVPTTVFFGGDGIVRSVAYGIVGAAVVERSLASLRATEA